MSNKIGQFEIQSEIHQSDRVTIYKAVDSELENPKPIVLKALRLEPFGEQAPTLVESLLQESQAGKLLKSQNIGLLHDAGEIDGLFCAQMEYVEGNSIATMLERKEGFSIWDVMDIIRQACQGLDFVSSKKLPHYTLEPAKIMVAWDGTVKVLSIGVSTMSAWTAQAQGVPPELLHYMSPEQLAGDPLDGRSNIFSLGAILYEMATERKAFGGDDAAGVRQAILEMAPVPPDQINCKLHPVLSHVIMKALAKSPDERFASGQELVKELDRCRESANKTSAKTAPTPAKKAAASAPAAKNVQAEKSARASAPPAEPTPSAKVTTEPAVRPASPAEFSPAEETPQVHRTKAAAASASGSAPVAGDQIVEWQTAPSPQIPTPPTQETELMSAFVAEEPAVRPKIAVDPLMAGESQTADAKRVSFSEIDELPPLKEVRIVPASPPPPPPDPDPIIQAMITKKAEPEKPKIQVREVAKKAVQEVQKTPPKLFLYSISAAVAVILVIVAAMAYHFHAENSADDNPPTPAPAETAPANQSVAAAAPVQPAPESSAQAAPVPSPAEETVVVSEKPKAATKKKTKAPAPQVVPVVAAGQLNVTSTPAGAQIQIDGRSDPAWLTPYDVSALQPGQHSVTISKPGFATDSRTIEVASGSKSFLSVQLAPLTAAASISSDPAGAEVWMDGKDMGKVTPAQFTVDRAGAHSFVLKKQGYLDETASANLQIGQISHLSPALRALGNTDDIKLSGGKFKKFLGGGGGGDTTGMGSIAVKTQPKGAQIAVNNRMLDKNSPLEFYLNPGNYVLEITLSGFKSVQRVVTVEKGGKVVIDETLDRE
jgi:serine/threonine-protein kinase